MKPLAEILSSRSLSILTKVEEGDVIQIRANMGDPLTGKTHWVKFTRARGWEHLCVSGRNNKVPSWELMCFAKSLFWEPEECCIQFHPRASQYVDNSECLHIWKPIGVDLPEPDPGLVGVQGVSQEETQRATRAFLDSISKEDLMALAEKTGVKINRAMKRGKGLS